ncbi:MAG: hypothetical protein E6182_10000 [Clostridioides difficile]|nr:hypothetical protein [Clostridioides difficile]
MNGCTTDFYINNETKMNIFINGVELNPMKVNTFKNQTCKAIIYFKNNLRKNEDILDSFIGTTNKGALIANIKTFDGRNVNIDIGSYVRFTKARKDTYNYCEYKGYKILSPYLGVKKKILIDFNCGHDSHWIIPKDLKHGYCCPICNESKGEKIIRLYLENNNIKFIQEHRFEDCKNKRSLPFDFYIPNYNLCIEFDGRQHFETFNHFGGEKGFELTKIRDKIKNKYCKNNGINLIRIPYYEIENAEKILDREFEKLRKELKEIV